MKKVLIALVVISVLSAAGISYSDHNRTYRNTGLKKLPKAI